jgi:methylenetetrahydrofolate--tRNA-(uracil-5-)-methyltransferase
VALVLARNGIECDLHEMRPGVMTPAHHTDLPAELVCSNSLKSTSPSAAHGVLKGELGLLDSPLLALAQACSVPAGSALAVDREQFGRAVLAALQSEPRIRLVRSECAAPPGGCDCCVIAAGPLASPSLTDWLAATFSSQALFFYDAIAPIVSADSLDMGRVFAASRREGEGSGDYLNCPFSEEEYRAFHEALTSADRVRAHEFEDARFFEGCLPVEVIASRGYLTLAFGPLKPIGLVDPRNGRRPFAVCQLRRETRGGESYNLVGFQTRLRVPEQERVFRMIPGMEQAEFLRYGSVHRNTYLDSPALLGPDLSFRSHPEIFLAGQMTGSEGYTESIATGHLAACAVQARLSGSAFVPPPDTTLCGALLRHVTASTEKPFTPSNVHFGLLPPLAIGTRRLRKHDKKLLLAERALADMRAWRDGYYFTKH